MSIDFRPVIHFPRGTKLYRLTFVIRDIAEFRYVPRVTEWTLTLHTLVSYTVHTYALEGAGG